MFPVITRNASSSSEWPCVQNHTPQTVTRASYVCSKTEIVTHQCANGKVIGFLPQTSPVISIKQIYVTPTHIN